MIDLAKIRQQQQRALDDAPVSCRRVLARAYSGKSKAAAVRAFCLRCVGYNRDDITNCQAFSCPIWPVRPFQHGDEPDDPADLES